MDSDSVSMDFLSQAVRAERIVCGIYLVTDTINDREPIKYNVRNNALDMVTAITKSDPGKGHSQEFIGQSIVGTLSLLEIAWVAGLISDMNYRILEREIRVLSQMHSANSSPPAGESNSLKESFFTLPVMPGKAYSREKSSEHLLGGSTHASSRDIPAKEPSASGGSRQSHVLACMAEGQSYSIKDIARAVPDCSEKTIQRALLGLIARGAVSKEGKRRWSRYRRNRPSA